MENKIYSKKANYILFALLIGYIVIYIDKLSVGFAIVSINQDIPMSESTQGLLMSIFFIGYALFQIPMSFMINRFGERAVILWSLIAIAGFDYMFSLSDTLIFLLITRLLSGMLAHSGYASASSKEIVTHFPIEKRSTAKGILISASGFAGILGPLLLPPIIEHFNWRFAYRILTLLALMCAVLLFFFIPKVQKKVEKTTESEKIYIRKLIRDPNIYLLILAAFCINNVLYGIGSWLPSYLVSARSITLIQAGIVSSISGAASLLGAILGNVIIHRVIKDKDEEIIIFSSLIGSCSLLVAYFQGSLTFFILLLSIASFFLTLTFVNIMSIPLNRYEGNQFAPVYASVATGGIVEGAVVQLIVGLLIDMTDSFSAAFIYFFIVGCLTSLAIFLIRKKATTKSIKETME